MRPFLDRTGVPAGLSRALPGWGRARVVVFPVEHRNCCSGDQVLDDSRKLGAGFGQAVEVVLALAARGNDIAVPQERQVVADGRLALAELGTQGADMALTLGEDQDHLKPGGVAHVLEQDRRPFGLLEPLIGGLDALGFAVGRPSCDRGLGTGLRCYHGTTLLSSPQRDDLLDYPSETRRRLL